MPQLTRRTLLAGAAIMAGNAALAQGAPPAPPAPAARAKGPLVWLDLDQKELDDAYDQSVYAPNLRQITGRYATNSEAVRARIGAPRRLAYGATPIEGLDLYASKTPNAPVQMFIHGGAWRGGLAKDYATPAEMFVEGSISTTSSRPTAT
jgi:arylformamidase